MSYHGVFTSMICSAIFADPGESTTRLRDLRSLGHLDLHLGFQLLALGLVNRHVLAQDVVAHAVAVAGVPSRHLHPAGRRAAADLPGPLARTLPPPSVGQHP
jgi:hypothetical protein